MNRSEDIRNLSARMVKIQDEERRRMSHPWLVGGQTNGIMAGDANRERHLMAVVCMETRQVSDQNFTISSIATDASFEDYHCMAGH